MSLSSLSIYPFQALIKRNSERPGMLFDPVRKKWLKETSEELVRQCLILWLKSNFSIPFNRMAVEKQLEVHFLKKRFDLVIYNKSSKPFILIECKAPDIPPNQAMFDQASIYNLKLQAPYLGICNGHHLILCFVDFENRNYSFIQELPVYPF